MKNKFKKIFLNFRNSIGALLFALKHPKVPLWSKIIISLAIAYALSPIDIIPDFIPFIGYLDDAVILPFLFFIAIKSIPQPVYDECMIKAQSTFKKSLGFVVLGIVLVFMVWSFICFIIYVIITRSIKLFSL